MEIRWSDEDQVFIVSLPEWGRFAKTHGTTYEQAARRGREVLEMLIKGELSEGRKLPVPRELGSKARRMAG
jgi:predicted RNase H-like HicB family nuclease